MGYLLLKLYSAALWLVQPLLRLKLRRRAAAEPLYGRWIDERFGIYGANSTPSAQGYVWIHAVSLGETRAAAILLTQLRQQMPNMQLLLTHSTATGREEGAKLLRAGDVQVWLPWDTLSATDRFMRQFKPRIGIVMETEVWPSLCSAAQRAGVPLVLANARLSAESLRKAQRIAWLARPAYGSFVQVWAQTQQDAERLAAAGARHVAVQGNIKFDATLPAAQLTQGRAWRAAGARPVVMLASSREGEEALFIEEIKRFSDVDIDKLAIKNVVNTVDLSDVVDTENAVVKDTDPSGSQRSGHAAGVQWLIVPRHPQRFDEVAAMLTGAGLSVSRRSQWQPAASSTEAVAIAPELAHVWLGDSLGEMALYYAMADCALLGGSFAPLGGQNLIEAIAAGCPVVMGPHTFNFADAATTAQEHGAALRVQSMAQGVQKAVALARHPNETAAMTAAGAQWLALSRGAVQRTAQAAAALLG
jgi:3-deoxy-D-manno-octulosonic-acid transferase